VNYGDHSLIPNKTKHTVPLFLLFCLSSLTLIALFALAVDPLRAGDSDEYLLMVQALSANGSADIRAADIQTHIQMLERSGTHEPEPLPNEHYLRGSSTTDRGKSYFGHFWFYSLLAVPAWILFRFAGLNEMAALQTMNVVFFCLAAGVVLFYGRGDRRARMLLLGLSAVGPVIWYLRWPHPEVFTWSAVLIAVVLLQKERFGMAAMMASLGALQYPPLFLLALLAIVLAAIRRNWRGAALATAGAAVSLVPVVFYLWLFGVPNLFVAHGVTDFSLITPRRVVSLLADLDQGILPYMPLTLLLGLAGGVLALARGRVRGILVMAVLLGMILLVAPQRNWNSGAAGMIRYAVWMVPLIAWLAVEYVPRGRFLVLAVAAGFLVQGGIVLSHDGKPDNFRHNGLARTVLTHCPKLYCPDPQIFAERQLGQEVDDWAGILPVPFVTEAGDVTKLLVDRQRYGNLADYFLVDGAEEWFATLEGERKGGVYYIHPPRGALRLEEPEGLLPAEFCTQLGIRLVKVPEIVSGPDFEIMVEVENQGPYRYWGQRPYSPYPLMLGYQLQLDDDVVKESRMPMPYVLKPGAVVRRKMEISVPGTPGVYLLTVGTLLDGLVWSGSTGQITVDCTGSGDVTLTESPKEGEDVPEDDPALRAGY
jgi:hypothetical protein